MTEFERAHERLEANPPDTKGTVRAVFEAMETLLKLSVGGGKISALGANDVGRYVVPMVQLAYSSDPIAKGAASQLAKGLADWINSAQPYRHGQEVEEPSPPPMNFAIAVVSAGATYIRWIVELRDAIESS